MGHSAQDLYTEYVDPRRDEWKAKSLSKLKKGPLQTLVKKERRVAPGADRYSSGKEQTASKV